MKLYILSVTNGVCVATDNVIVKVNSLSVNAGTDKTICNNSSVNLYAITTGTTNATFKWNTGANTKYVSVTPLTTSTYKVTATNTEGCTATDDVVVKVISCKNNDSNNNKVNNNIKENSISIFPNPSNGIYDIEANLQSTTAKIKVMNILGVSVYESNIKADSKLFKTKLNISNLPDGLYMLVIEANGQKTVRNIIKN
jgi:hypothetical protein